MRRLRCLIDGPDRDATMQWLDTLGVLVEQHEPGSSIGSTDAEILWIHGSSLRPPDLLVWLQRGGRLLATLEAARLPFDLGLESILPNDIRSTTWHHSEDEFWLPEYRSFQAFPHVRGFGAFGVHPLFAGVDQGTYTWAPSEGEPLRWMTYCGLRPAGGSVVAVERSFIHLNPERAVAWEYAVGEGGILCLGAFVHPAAPDPLLRRQLFAVLENAIAGDAIPHRDRAVPVALWPARATRNRRDPNIPVPIIPGMEAPWSASQSSIALGGAVVQDEPWTLAGRRMLLVGSESSGLKEAWSHPFRMMKDVSLTVNGRPASAESITIQPDQVNRVIYAGRDRVTERWTTATERPILIGELASEAEAEIRLQWSVDLRRMWPYPPGAYGDLRWNLNEGADHLWVGGSGAPVQVLFRLLGGTFTSPPSSGDVPAMTVVATGQGTLRLVAVAAVDSDDLSATLRALEKKQLDGIQRQRKQHAERILTQGVGIEAPDDTLPLAFEWAKIRSDSFLAETPGVGRSLLAGYGPSRPGWADGRPGYAWYFGRDACWTAFALLAAGDREGPRDTIHFLSVTQDVSGKVLHEYTTSGLVHYDAADSTPLFLLLVARYAAWTGDLDFIRKHRDAITRAYRFCLETDSDGDGLIENSRVGHGWIEHGPLGGAHVTLYLAACWIAALEELEPVAEALGWTELGEEMRAHAARARDAVDQRFRVAGEFALGLKPDGAPIMHRTAMLAVPLLLGIVDGKDTPRWLDAMGTTGFTSPWGVRMLAADDPLFDPAGYHRGAVWPLYTGWVSLAEWRAGRYEAALKHLLTNASLVYQRARGAFDEVLHGLEYRDAGICPDQAWSAAMVISPTVAGLWGVVPDAINSEVSVAPYLPSDWSRMGLRRLRVGRTVLDFEIRRRATQILVRVRRTFGPGLHLRFTPRGLPRPVMVEVDGVELGNASVRFEVSNDHEIIYSF